MAEQALAALLQLEHGPDEEGANSGFALDGLAALGMNQDSTNLDFLRSVAVLLVLLDHVCTFFNVRQIGIYSTYEMGHLDVLLFFVHTSLVLMLALELQQ